MKPHKHAELIKAWADGAEIQKFDERDHEWCDAPSPTWLPANVYRIKSDPKPDDVYYGVFVLDKEFGIDACFTKRRDKGDEIKLTFDGETGKLKSAEVL